MKKEIVAIIALMLFMLSAGTVETAPLISGLSIISMAVAVKIGKLYEA